MMYRIAGKFQRENLHEFRDFTAIRESFSPQNFSHATPIYAISLTFHKMIPSY